MSGLIRRIAESHFQGLVQETLMHALCKAINDDNLFEVFMEDNLQLKRAATRVMKKRMHDESFVHKVTAALYGDPKVREGVLMALSYIPKERFPS